MQLLTERDYFSIINGVVKVSGSFGVFFGIAISSLIFSEVHCFQNNKEESFWLTNLTAGA